MLWSLSKLCSTYDSAFTSNNKWATEHFLSGFLNWSNEAKSWILPFILFNYFYYKKNDAKFFPTPQGLRECLMSLKTWPTHDPITYLCCAGNTWLLLYLWWVSLHSFICLIFTDFYYICQKAYKCLNNHYLVVGLHAWLKLFLTFVWSHSPFSFSSILYNFLLLFCPFSGVFCMFSCEVQTPHF